VNGQRAVFLDRDGVLTEPVWNPATNGPERVREIGLTPDQHVLARGEDQAGGPSPPPRPAPRRGTVPEETALPWRPTARRRASPPPRREGPSFSSAAHSIITSARR
jgi:hypothetical protein